MAASVDLEKFNHSGLNASLSRFAILGGILTSYYGLPKTTMVQLGPGHRPQPKKTRPIS